MGQEVCVNAPLHTIRHMGEIAFVILRKRDGLLQCVYESGRAEFDLKDLKEAAAVEVTGVPEEESRAPGGIELCMRSVKILSMPSVPHAASDLQMEARHFPGGKAEHAFYFP